jgi:hypothetical protein
MPQCTPTQHSNKGKKKKKQKGHWWPVVSTLESQAGGTQV